MKRYSRPSPGTQVARSRAFAYTPGIVTRWIRTPDALAELASDLARCRAIALDTESDSLYHHFEKVCLVQLATDTGQRLPRRRARAARSGPLGPVLADPGVVKVLHGADYDVTTLKRDFGFSFASLFDTMIAARLLGRAEIGLVAVVRDELGDPPVEGQPEGRLVAAATQPQAGGLRAGRRRAPGRAARTAAGEARGAGTARLAARGVRGRRGACRPRAAARIPKRTCRSRARAGCRRAGSRRCASCTPGASARRPRRIRRPSASSATRRCCVWRRSARPRCTASAGCPHGSCAAANCSRRCAAPRRCRPRRCPCSSASPGR